MAVIRRMAAIVSSRQSYTGTAPNPSSRREVLLGEVVPLALLAVLMARPIVYRLADFFEDFLCLLDPSGFFEQQGITGTGFLTRVVSQRGIFIKRSIGLPLQLEATCIEQMTVGRGVTRIGFAQSFQRELGFVCVAERKQRAGQPQHQCGIGCVDAGERLTVERRRCFGLTGAK